MAKRPEVFRDGPAPLGDGNNVVYLKADIIYLRSIHSTDAAPEAVALEDGVP